MMNNPPKTNIAIGTKEHKQNYKQQNTKESMNKNKENRKDKDNKLQKNQQINNSKGYNLKKSKEIEQPYEFNGYLIPLIFAIAILPLIVKYITYNPKLSQFSWFSNTNTQTDFFLFYKHWIFVGFAALMAVILAVSLIRGKIHSKFQIVLIPVMIYGFLAILSAVFSKFSYFSFHGSIDQMESVFAVLGYCIIIFYSYVFVNTEYDVKVLMKCLLVSVLILIVLGLTQFIGHDFFMTNMGLRILVSPEFANGHGKLSLVFGKNVVYLTMFNPNYVGVYVAMVAPVMLVLLIFSKKIVNSILYFIAFVGLIICGIGCKSLAGVIGIAVAFVGVAIFMWRYLLKRFYITIPVLLILIAVLFAVNIKTDNYMVKRIWNALHPVKTEKNLTDIVTGDKQVTFTYKGNKFSISLDPEDSGTSSYQVKLVDGNNNNVQYVYSSETGAFTIQDDRFNGITFNIQNCAGLQSICVNIEGKSWFFSNSTGDGTYYYYNRYNRWDKIVTPKSAVFTGYESLASSRGYLWARTIPLIKDYLILGSGPDTFTMAFPQRDYVGFYNYSYESSLVTKPHNLYLQIAIQTGLISLIAFLVFYVIYFISSVRLYIRGRFNSYYAEIGVAILVGTMAYMITGLSDDSSITTAPVFWCLMGIGIAVNRMAKPLIDKEKAEMDAKKSAMKADTIGNKSEEA